MGKSRRRFEYEEFDDQEISYRRKSRGDRDNQRKAKQFAYEESSLNDESKEYSTHYP